MERGGKGKVGGKYGKEGIMRYQEREMLERSELEKACVEVYTKTRRYEIGTDSGGKGGERRGEVAG